MNANIAERVPLDQDNSEQDPNQDQAIIRAKEIQRAFRKNILPDRFFLDEDGVWFQPEPRGEEPPPRIYICSPLEVTALVRDKDNENWGRLLEFRDLDNHLHEWILPMSMMARDGAEYRDELLNRGLLIAHGSKPKALLTEYIQRCQPIVRARCVLQTGWSGQTFVLPRESIGVLQTEKILYQGPNYIQTGHGKKGSLESWQRMSKLCQGNSRLVFSISAAFTSPFLSLLGEENGGFHFRGPSSIGKTTALKIANSVWGDQTYLQRWRVTTNGLEAIASNYNDSLLCLDEIEQMQPFEIGEVAYMLANGSGKGRSDKNGALKKRSTWHLLFLSTGEISLADHMQQGGKKVRAGQEIRILDIPANTGKFGIFEELHEFESPSSFAEYLCKEIRENYGIAAIEFLKKLTNRKDEILNDLKLFSSKIQVRMVPKDVSGQVIRAGRRFALVAAAGEIATMLGITGWEIGEAEKAAMVCFNDWLISRGFSGLQEEQEALSKVRKFFEQYGDSRFSSFDSDPMETKTINRAGVKKNTADGIEYFVFPETFRTEICAGFDLNLLIKACIKKGWLREGLDGKATRAERMWKNSKPTRCYRFTSKVLHEEE